MIKNFCKDLYLWDELTKFVKPLKSKDKNLNKKSSQNIVIQYKDNFNNQNFLKCSSNLSNCKEIKLGQRDKIDSHKYNKIKKNFIVDAKLDLHGCNLEFAFLKFSEFIESNFLIGSRNLLVITGIGNTQKNTGVIKQNFPIWIQHFKNIILYCDTSNQKDGGQGAFYIVLKKNKNI